MPARKNTTEKKATSTRKKAAKPAAKSTVKASKSIAKSAKPTRQTKSTAKASSARKASAKKRSGRRGRTDDIMPNAHMVAMRAFDIWKNNGCTPGTEMQNWLQAEHELNHH